MDIQIRRGARARELRKARGLTQEELAAKSGVSVHTLWMLEKGEGKPLLETMENLAAAYNMSVGELLTWLDDPADTPRAQALRDITDLCRQLDDPALELVKGQVGCVVGYVRG